jgi:large subunit ribosomal protein L19
VDEENKMSENLLSKIEEGSNINDHPSFSSGDTVKVSVQVKEGDKTRIQVYEGTVIAKHGNGVHSTFTVRSISHGVGVERIFPLNCPNVKEIKVSSKGKVRRSKLYYLRDRQGKAAKVKTII